MRAHPRVTRKNHEERLARRARKQEKLDMLEALIYTWEHSANPNFTELKSLKRRANEIRTQINVLSTIPTK